MNFKIPRLIRTFKYFSFLFLLLLLESSCGNSQQRKEPMTEKEVREKMIGVNKEMVKGESEEIEAYIKRHGLDMKQTGTGLRYMIYKQGSGEKAENGKVAKISFNVKLLDGTECYNSEKKGPQEFTIGRDNVESGLHEGILLMHVGDKAMFIMPPHLAHGLIGDEKKIPALSTIIYDVELVGLR